MTLPEWLEQMLSVVIGAGVLAGGLGYLISAIRKNAANAWRENYEALEEKVDLLQKNLTDKTEELLGEKERNAHLSGQVQQLTTQVSELRQLVMGEKVPQALADALTGATNRVLTRIGELEDNTATALGAMGDRILTQLPPPKENAS